ncbi:MAG: hypothetical protein H6898_16800 [Rhodobacter sp.]|nr:hypothetical protein [Paracoccaceae bacterium]MCC0078215.1 hypothetical protein [Rhodobacter sp.]
MTATRRNLSVAALTSLAVLAAGCSGMSYARETYDGVPVVQFQHGEGRWRIFDKPSDNRLMITPSLGRVAASGAVSGLTLGLAGGPTGPMAGYQAAAQAYLDGREGGCTVVEGHRILTSQYEFTYTCG